MADTAAHLVDRVLPHVPVRQWVLSLPYSLRFRAAFDSTLMGEVLGIFVREVSASLRTRASALPAEGNRWTASRGPSLELVPRESFVSSNDVKSHCDVVTEIFAGT